jgi:glutamyl-tRNA synthetase
VHGSLTFDNNEIDDFVILRSDNIPTYHLAVVVDDFEMKISHVIRGDDHLTNTPKQILLYQALGWKLPKFIHVPLILGSDKKRLSKRHGATAVTDFFNKGIVENALFNFLALLGWSPGDEKEILSRSELIERFDLKGINKASAIFDEAKLVWMNSQHINLMTDDALHQRLLPLFASSNDFDIRPFSAAYIKTAIKMLKSRIKVLPDIIKFGYYFFKDPAAYDETAVNKYWRGENVIESLIRSKTCLADLNNFSEKSIEDSLRSLAVEMEIGAGKLIHPIRLALTGFAVSPGLFELIAVLGKDVTIRRLDRAIQYLKSDK